MWNNAHSHEWPRVDEDFSPLQVENRTIAAGGVGRLFSFPPHRWEMLHSYSRTATNVQFSASGCRVEAPACYLTTMVTESLRSGPHSARITWLPGTGAQRPPLLARPAMNNLGGRPSGLAGAISGMVA
jgi:hypothetical protein